MRESERERKRERVREKKEGHIKKTHPALPSVSITTKSDLKGLIG